MTAAPSGKLVGRTRFELVTNGLKARCRPPNRLARRANLCHSAPPRATGIRENSQLNHALTVDTGKPARVYWSPLWQHMSSLAATGDPVYGFTATPISISDTSRENGRQNTRAGRVAERRHRFSRHRAPSASCHAQRHLTILFPAERQQKTSTRTTGRVLADHVGRTANNRTSSSGSAGCQDQADRRTASVPSPKCWRSSQSDPDDCVVTADTGSL